MAVSESGSKFCPLGIGPLVSRAEYKRGDKRVRHIPSKRLRLIREVPNADCGFVKTEEEINQGARSATSRCRVCGAVCKEKRGGLV